MTLFIDQANLGNPYPSVDTNVTFDTLTSRKIKNGAARCYSMKLTFMSPCGANLFA